MQLFLGAVPIILTLFSIALGHLLFSNYSRNNLPKSICEWQWGLCQNLPLMVVRTMVN